MSYDDIISLPHHQSTSRPHMSLYDRAAQFAPFAALHGHATVISHTADRHVADVNAPQFEEDYLLHLLSEQDYE
ncbi:MAG: hypothetical protein IK058_03680 [Bacteroidales bacterium]|nr:hypothetical protein [Bacteroidales bacterium]